ncbi:SpoIIIAH-like family protein [Neobacillus notoginsengisoli]|uniref:SpoIIIAH-like family protein n=1 Tax=Neobacillus notoginsengisoli TaxID=1578198 RepID=A0A417YV93_9BACI|nr:SpoIIIAH-like family protein [Neobacillus notoginsengisoli]RHW41115.1 SpoIIIAH-like family protein [Neobacillus notoginsengisoli]
MLLKKQTVWLLTMLSLVIVLSVYYITSEPQSQTKNDFASTTEKAKEKAGSKENPTATSEDGKTTVTETASGEGFESLRLKLTDTRNQQIEEYEIQAGSADLPAIKKSEALDKIAELTEIGRKEEILEALLKQTMGYEDALVRADGDHVRVTVKTKEKHSAKAANEIIQLVRSEIGSMKITAVEFKPAK